MKGCWHSRWCAIDVGYYIKPNGITMAYIFLYIKGGPPGSLLRGSVWPFSKSRTAKKTLARCPEKNILWNYICWSALYMIWRKTVIFLHWLFGGNSKKWGFLCPPSLYQTKSHNSSSYKNLSLLLLMNLNFHGLRRYNQRFFQQSLIKPCHGI